ncbi:putative receptor-like serine/threonine-protein kinase [Carex littledalei]|uniref:Putative receptor-like serine/threonine-protein kinase n=1 Tax=Carex littledalei TaxID=544730 RepID=A0A833R6U7_9POAL|nr:putative receptor-like serine/threonine-protein kinase [Carex littledalei]
MKLSKQEGGNSQKTMRRNKHKCSAVAATATSSSDDEGISRGGSCERNNSRNTVVVGIKLDAQSKELLTWALVKVAGPGDRVYAIHVVPDPSNFSKRLEESLVSILSVYDGFCNLKQIDLKLKICRGRSVSKALELEAISHGATNLIVGVTKSAFGSPSTSMAKHCAKRLPATCSVLAVSNGKIIFRRDTVPHTKSKAKATPRKSYSNSTSSKTKAAPERTISLPSRSPTLQKDQSIIPPYTPNKYDLLSTAESNSNLDPTSIGVSPDDTPGWPFLRKKPMLERKFASLEKSNLSVVQWAMRLPSRYTAVSPSRQNFNFEHKMGMFETTVTGFRPELDKTEVKKLPKELVSLQEKYKSIFTLFSYSELQQITSNFAPWRIIGKGGSSCVYRGCSSDNLELAVKILKLSEENMKEFISEIEILGELQNDNIISLVGFCFENDSLILVYEYLPRGSLEEILHGGKEHKDTFGWNERYKVALGVASALNYLHGHGNHRPVIHRDVKSSNILLYMDFEPKLSDFGLALWASDLTSRTTCNDVLGTFGYLAPEYFMYGKVNEKIDVYAFGVVLLELISGRKPVSTGCPKGQESLVMWAHLTLQEGKVGQLLDPSLPTESCSDQIERLILAASLCIRRAPQSRPHITMVLKLLQGDKDMLRWARSQISGVSTEYGAEDNEITGIRDSKIQSYINLAFLDLDDDSTSVGSVETPNFITANTSLEEYLKGRWSRSSSFQ